MFSSGKVLFLFFWYFILYTIIFYQKYDEYVTEISQYFLVNIDILIVEFMKLDINIVKC